MSKFGVYRGKDEAFRRKYAEGGTVDTTGTDESQGGVSPPGGDMSPAAMSSRVTSENAGAQGHGSTSQGPDAAERNLRYRDANGNYPGAPDYNPKTAGK